MFIYYTHIVHTLIIIAHNIVYTYMYVTMLRLWNDIYTHMYAYEYAYMYAYIGMYTFIIHFIYYQPYPFHQHITYMSHLLPLSSSYTSLLPITIYCWESNDMSCRPINVPWNHSISICETLPYDKSEALQLQPLEMAASFVFCSLHHDDDCSCLPF